MRQALCIFAALFGLAISAQAALSQTDQIEECSALKLIKHEKPKSLAELGMQASPKAGLLTPTFLQTVAAPCARDVRVYNGEYYMNDGRTLRPEQNGVSTIERKRDRSKFYNSNLSTNGNPFSGTDGFVGSYKAFTLAKDRTVTDNVYVGIWKAGEGSEVRIFQVNKNGEVVGDVKPILASKRAIRSIAYHNGPDGGMAILSILLENPDQSVDAVAISWINPWWQIRNR